MESGAMTKKERTTQWSLAMVAQFRPKNAQELESRMNANRRALMEKSGDPDMVAQLVMDSYAYAHYRGIRRGFVLGKAIGKLNPTQKAVIPQLVKNPLLSAQQICKALDKAKRKVPPYWKKTLDEDGHTNRWWTDALENRRLQNKVEVHCSRLRARAAEIKRLGLWKRVMKEHQTNRKIIP